MLLAEGPDVVRHPVDDDRDRQERPAHNDAEGKHVQREFVHHRGLRVGSRLRALTRNGGAAVEVRRDAGQDHQRYRHCGNSRPAEDRVRREAVLLGDCRTNGRTEKVGVQEVADIGSVKEIVAQ